MTTLEKFGTIFGIWQEVKPHISIIMVKNEGKSKRDVRFDAEKCWGYST